MDGKGGSSRTPLAAVHRGAAFTVQRTDPVLAYFVAVPGHSSSSLRPRPYVLPSSVPACMLNSGRRFNNY